jgi:hypothetical protein
VGLNGNWWCESCGDVWNRSRVMWRCVLFGRGCHRQWSVREEEGDVAQVEIKGRGLLGLWKRLLESVHEWLRGWEHWFGYGIARNYVIWLKSRSRDGGFTTGSGVEYVSNLTKGCTPRLHPWRILETVFAISREIYALLRGKLQSLKVMVDCPSSSKFETKNFPIGGPWIVLYLCMCALQRDWRR